jgi:hypothetical protein
VISLADATTLDTLIAYEFTDIKNILTIFKSHPLPQKAKNALEAILKEIETPIDITDIQQVTNHYHKLVNFFARVAALSPPGDFLDNANEQSLYTFCQQKRAHLVHYFAQCDTLRTVPNDSRIEVFRAVSEAATAFVQALEPAPAGQYKSIEKITFHDDEVTYEVRAQGALLSLTNNVFFQAITRVETYHSLFTEIEKNIVEQRQGDTEVVFQHLILTESDKYPEQGFKLHIEVLINDRERVIDLHFDALRETVYCDAESLQGLNLSAVLAENLNRRSGNFADRLSRLNTSTDKLDAFIEGIMNPDTKPNTRLGTGSTTSKKSKG